MVKRKRGSGNTPDNKSERPRAHRPPEGTRPHPTAARNTHPAAHPQTPAGPPTRDTGVPFPGFSRFEILRYWLLWLWQLIPARYRPMLVVCVAVVVTLISLGGLAYRYQWILGFPDIRVVVYNDSDKPGLIPGYGLAEPNTGSGENPPDYPTRIRVRGRQAAEDGSFRIEPKEELEVRLQLPTNRALHSIYREAHASLDVRFYGDRRHTDLQWSLNSIPFNREALVGTVPVPPIIMRDKDSLPQTAGIHVCFSIRRDAPPGCLKNLESAQRLLERADRCGFFWIVAPEVYQQEKRWAAEPSEKYSAIVTSLQTEDTAVRRPVCPIVAEVTLVGYAPRPSGTTWTFEVSDARGKIQNRRVAVDCGPLPLTRVDAEKIWEQLRHRIVWYYGIEGRITEITPREDYYEATLSVGTFMGVTEGMTFDVLPPRRNKRCGTVEIKRLPLGTTGAAGPFTGPDFDKNNYEEFEGYRVIHKVK